MKHAGKVLAWALFVGYAAIPLSVLVSALEKEFCHDARRQNPRGSARPEMDHTIKNHAKIISPANKRKFKIIIVGSGLAGGAAAATLGEQGFNIECFCYQDSPRRAHSIAAQGGINAAKNYQNDGDSVFRLFYDTDQGRRLPRP